MNLKNFVSILLFFFIFSGCQTIKEKSDSIVEKENKKLFFWYFNWNDSTIVHNGFYR